VNTIRILVADEHAVVREGLKALIGAQLWMAVVGEAADGPSTLHLASALDPDLVVVEVALPGLDGAEVTARLRATRPGQKVLALTACEEKRALRRMLAAGAGGYVLKRAAAEQLVQALRTVAAGGTYLDPEVAAGVVGPPREGDADGEPRAAGLSEREAEVVRLIALGYSNKEIAARLRLSVKTVETYKTRSMEKLGIKSRVDIVRYAARHGWLAHAEPAPPTADGVSA